MKFVIHRTSGWIDKPIDNDYRDQYWEKPCKNAYEEKRSATVHRWIKDENGKKIKQQYERGYMVWCIDINSIEDLVALANEVKEELIVGDHYYPSVNLDQQILEPIIEIYDEYRE